MVTVSDSYFRRGFFCLIFLLPFLLPVAAVQAQNDGRIVDFYRGIISLPDGFIATGQEQITIRFSGGDPFNPIVREFTLVIQADESEGVIQLNIQRDGAPPGWNISILCEGCDANISAERGFATTEFGDPLILQSQPVFNFASGEDFEDLVLTFIATGPPPTAEPEPNPNSAPVLIPTIDLLLNSD